MNSLSSRGVGKLRSRIKAGFFWFDSTPDRFLVGSNIGSELGSVLMWLVEQQNPPLHPHTAPDMNASAYVAHAPSLIEACDVNGAGRGYFLKNGAGVPAGTALLHCKAPVSVLNDAHESKNCRNCLQPIDHDESRTATVEYMTATTASSSDSGNRALPSTTAGPREFVCTGCRRSAICSSCYNVNSHEEAGTIAAPNNSAPDTLHSHGSSPHNGGGGDSITTVAHSVLECEALANLSRLQLAQPHLASSLLGSSTVYLRLLLQLLALRATTARQSRRARRNEPEAARVARER